MTELFTVRTPTEAWAIFLQNFSPQIHSERIATWDALDRTLAETIVAPQNLPEFTRSAMDGYAVNAADTFGASAGLPAFLTVVGEVPMGQAAQLSVDIGEAVLVHTGGMVPEGATAVVMVEQTQRVDETSIEVMKPVADGENVIQPGEDVHLGDQLLQPGHRLRPQEIGGLVALGIVEVTVAKRPHVAIISSGDEVVAPTGSRRSPGRCAMSIPMRWQHWCSKLAGFPSAIRLCLTAALRSMPLPSGPLPTPTLSFFRQEVRSAIAT